MKLISDDRAEHPIQVILTWIVFILVFAFIYTIMSTYVDGVTYYFLKTPIQLSDFGQQMMAKDISLGQTMYLIPSIMLAVIVVWGFKAIYRKHTYNVNTGQYETKVDDF